MKMGKINGCLKCIFILYNVLFVVSGNLKKQTKRFILVFMIDFPQVIIYVEGKRDQFIKKIANVQK